MPAAWLPPPVHPAPPSHAPPPLQPAPPEGEVYETSNTTSPRRTHKIKFTCGRCDAVNIKPINPHAWTAGSVFARCGKCNVTHKVGQGRGAGGGGRPGGCPPS